MPKYNDVKDDPQALAQRYDNIATQGIAMYLDRIMPEKLDTPPVSATIGYLPYGVDYPEGHSDPGWYIQLGLCSSDAIGMFDTLQQAIDYLADSMASHSMATPADLAQMQWHKSDPLLCY
jgi:hypothetical protein